MKKHLRNNIVLLIVLILSAILFILLDDKFTVHNRGINSIFFIIATFIVTMTIYILLKTIIQKHPRFLEEGIWKNPLNTLFIGTFSLFVFVLIFVLASNNLEPTPIMNKIMTFIMAYPVSFVLVLMVDAFYKRIFNVDREKRLFISAMSIVLGLAVMILIGLLGTR
ncbi:hypothetical protein ACLIBG_10520 [Virgibacillus sp. W0181]|uniref:hypothetical protein n=1 Tax=Virgibacillus sp. W0181 TaxID=3391581 RepID=UPI003F45831F